ncbi:adenylate kinase [Balamuthia mandrillaris]
MRNRAALSQLQWALRPPPSSSALVKAFAPSVAPYRVSAATSVAAAFSNETLLRSSPSPSLVAANGGARFCATSSTASPQTATVVTANEEDYSTDNEEDKMATMALTATQATQQPPDGSQQQEAEHAKAVAEEAEALNTAEAQQQKREQNSIKNAEIIFETAWDKLVKKYGAQNMLFPKEIIWLMGAPGSGKGTNTPFIQQARGLVAQPLVLSTLLDTPELRQVKAEGGMISDSQVVEALLDNLIQPIYRIGALVDGFPRTKIQVDIITLLHDRMLRLKRTDPNRFPRPVFRMAVLYVEEKTSIERQMLRGRAAKQHNEEVQRTGIGALIEERATDQTAEAASKRYSIFKEHFDTLTTLRERFPFHLVNAQGSIEDVRARILKQFEYQSSLELDEQTFDQVEQIPLPSQLTLYARQHLVKRLDDYQAFHPDLFKQAIQTIKHEFMPDIQKHCLSGAVLIRSENPLWDNQQAVNMAIDVLSERGYSVSFDTKLERFPERVDPKTFQIISTYSKKFYFQVKFRQAHIRGHSAISSSDLDNINAAAATAAATDGSSATSDFTSVDEAKYSTPLSGVGLPASAETEQTPGGRARAREAAAAGR